MTKIVTSLLWKHYAYIACRQRNNVYTRFVYVLPVNVSISNVIFNLRYPFTDASAQLCISRFNWTFCTDIRDRLNAAIGMFYILQICDLAQSNQTRGSPRYVYVVFLLNTLYDKSLRMSSVHWKGWRKLHWDITFASPQTKWRSVNQLVVQSSQRRARMRLEHLQGRIQIDPGHREDPITSGNVKHRRFPATVCICNWISALDSRFFSSLRLSAVKISRAIFYGRLAIGGYALFTIMFNSIQLFNNNL